MSIPPTNPTVTTPPVNTVGSYGKAIIATVYNTLLAVVIALTDGGINGLEWVTIAGTLVLSALGVVSLSNKRSPYLKPIIAAVTAAIGSLSTALFDGSLTGPELVAVIVAVGGALGLTASISNAAYSDRHLQAQPARR